MKARKEIQQLVERYRTVWALNHASQVMRWDLETYMPPEGTAARGASLSEVSLLMQRFTLELAPDVEKAERMKELTDHERGFLRLLRRRIDYYTKVPPELVSKIQKATTEARVVWREARAKSDFALFKPHLERLLELKKEEGEKLAEGEDPYDALLDQSEEGLSSSIMDSIFSKLIPSLKQLLSKVTSASYFPSRHELEEVKYDVSAMAQLNSDLLSLLQMPSSRFRMDISTHPFTINFDVNDVRITTRYEGKDFKSSMYSTIHESGHAIYELQVSSELAFTPLARGASSGFHESQSRFWENVVGRSREFVKLVEPYVKKHLSFTSKYDKESLFKYFNTVKPSKIRVDADELTYNFHIALRYNVEKKLFKGEASVSDVPELWNDTLQEYLGIKPRNDAEGCLQDIHWSHGGFASFPNYTVGNVIAGMCYQRMKKEIDLKKQVEDGNINEIKEWLRKNIHQHGSTYSPKELQQKVFGKQYDAEPLLEYLREKFIT
ncbi:MAG: carboxypeptidase M32 [Conexivisphaerales archaeon]